MEIKTGLEILFKSLPLLNFLKILLEQLIFMVPILEILRAFIRFYTKL